MQISHNSTKFNGKSAPLQKIYEIRFQKGADKKTHKCLVGQLCTFQGGILLIKGKHEIIIIIYKIKLQYEKKG